MVDNTGCSGSGGGVDCCRMRVYAVVVVVARGVCREGSGGRRRNVILSLFNRLKYLDYSGLAWKFLKFYGVCLGLAFLLSGGDVREAAKGARLLMTLPIFIPLVILWNMVSWILPAMLIAHGIKKLYKALVAFEFNEAASKALTALAILLGFGFVVVPLWVPWMTVWITLLEHIANLFGV